MRTAKSYRVSHRPRGFDYSGSGAYYITLCTYRQRCIFGTVRSGKMQLNNLGEIALEEWMKTPSLRPGVRLGEFEVMPNHMHGILIIMEEAGDLPVAPTRPKRFDAADRAAAGIGGGNYREL